MSDPQQTTLPVDSDSTTPLPTGDNETSSNLLASAAISASASSLNSVASSRASALTNKSGIRPPSKIGLLHGARPKTLQPAQEPAASSNSSAILTEDTDSFIIGQRVWVGGNKPGHIAFIGDTTFAPGEWAGIALDEPIGKNDGSVGGTRYFMCEPKKGVFCRLTRLTRVPLDHGGSSDMTPFSTPTSQIGSHRMLGMSPSPTESHRSMMKSPVSPFDSNTSLSSGQVDYTLGDRVIIKSGQGSKVGTVRYMGLTEFAKGEWIGVELDEPRGKNDGSVNGIRYFECQPRFGIFSPISKVSKSPSNVKPIHCQVHSPTGGVPSSGLRRASSKESITSNLSMMSSASTAPRRKSPTTPNTTTRTVAARTAWQAVLEEKQKHIEQLLKEKDLDRAEATRAASQASEAERKLLVSTQEFAKYREECGAQLQKHLRLLNELKENRLELETQLEDEKKKNEDWQFKYEEAEIFRAHIQAQSETRNKEYDNLMLEHEKLKTKAQEQLEELRKANDAQANSDNVTINFQTEMQTAQLELEAVKKDLSQCQTNLSDIKCKLEGERDELHNSLQLKISEVDNLRKELSDTVTARDKSLAERAGELEEKLESIDNLNNVLIQQKEESKKILNELIEQHKKALDERDSNISQINSAIANKEKDISQLNIKISELESTIVNKNDEFEKLKSEMELVLEKSKTDADIIANLIKENENNNNLLNIETNLRQELGSVKVQLENVTEKLNIKTAETENIIQENKNALDEKDSIISQINSVIANKAEDISQLNIQISELESTIVSKNTEFEKLKSEMEHVLEKSKTEADIIANLIKENENNNNLLNIETNLRQQLDSIKVQLENVTEKLNIKTAETENIIQENKKALDEKDSIISQINTVIANKAEDISQLSIKIAELERTIANKNAEFEKLKSEMERVKEKGKADAEIIGNLNSESKNNNLLNVETNLREELDNVKLQLNIKTAEIENIIQEKNSIALKLEAKINELNKIESELILRTDNLEQKRIIESSLKEQLNEAKLELNSEHAKLVAEKDELRNVAQSLEEKLDQANIALAEKTKQVVEKDDAIVQLNENQKKINDAAQSLEEKLDQANIALAEKTKQVGEKDDAIIQLNENQRKLNDAAQSLEEKLDQANIALAEKTKLVVEKDDTIIQLNENQSKLNAAAQSLEEKLDQANIALAEKTKQVVEKDDTIIQLNENQKKLNDKMENCEKDIKTKSEEIRTLNQQIEHGNTLLRANTEQVNNLTELMSNEENFLRTALDALETENQRSELNSKVLEQKLVNVESEKKLLDLKVQEASAQVTELEQKVLEKDGLIKSLKLEAEKVKANNELVMEEHAESIIKDAENEFKKKIDEVSLKWEAKVMDLQAEIFMLKDQLSMAVQPTSSSIAIAGPSGSVIKPEDTPEYRKLLEGKAYSDAQLEFVNSIIVDMLKKNEEHLMRIDLLEQGYSPAFVERAKESGYKVPERQVAPRKYCDICQEFDQHETEDCPKQESDEPLSSVQLGKEKKEKPPPRPYCTICEEFGHDTADCTVSQEF